MSRLKINHPLNPYLINPKSSIMMSWDSYIGMWLLAGRDGGEEGTGEGASSRDCVIAVYPVQFAQPL